MFGDVNQSLPDQSHGAASAYQYQVPGIGEQQVLHDIPHRHRLLGVRAIPWLSWHEEELHLICKTASCSYPASQAAGVPSPLSL